MTFFFKKNCLRSNLFEEYRNMTFFKKKYCLRINVTLEKAKRNRFNQQCDKKISICLLVHTFYCNDKSKYFHFWLTFSD